MNARRASVKFQTKESKKRIENEKNISSSPAQVRVSERLRQRHLRGAEKI
ncbi:hypothetical protein CAMRE0001_3192 [Campylobacter rectus RM3267]|uniref:Uncharacterized protein n=1 Tax=Campylobacter rectus RM3267 TaxID=553218 RepID=B9D1A6_CAMRE|nr:hypothetical protein CAMRE0001_3192 [Campylobacter rectus RM3267]